jgi:hypothetical protein
VKRRKPDVANDNTSTVSRGANYEVITPAGRVYQFPRPTLLKLLLMVLYTYADTAAVSAAILCFFT